MTSRRLIAAALCDADPGRRLAVHHSGGGRCLGPIGHLPVHTI